MGFRAYKNLSDFPSPFCSFDLLPQKGRHFQNENPKVDRYMSGVGWLLDLALKHNSLTPDELCPPPLVPGRLLLSHRKMLYASSMLVASCKSPHVTQTSRRNRNDMLPEHGSLCYDVELRCFQSQCLPRYEVKTWCQEEHI